MRRVILASASLRRSAILSSCGIAHSVVPSGIEEILDKEKPVSEIVKTNAVMKASFVASGRSGEVVIGADTLVVCSDNVIGKPKDAAEAKNILRSFSGRKISVYTGLCVIDTSTGVRSSGADESCITVPKLEEDDVESYFPFLGPYDKAGGFSIEGAGAIFFDDIKGSYFNILGLSLMSLKRLFTEAGLDILDFMGG